MSDGMKSVTWTALSPAERRAVLARPGAADDRVRSARVAAIIERVRAGGDADLRALTRELDGVDLAAFEVSPAEWAEADTRVAPVSRAALAAAAGHIETFHAQQIPHAIGIETAPGVYCERHPRAIESVGLYAPGGSAPLLSTVLMLGIPSRIARCPERILCSPPGRDGRLDPNLLHAARVCGIERVFKLGGAQAIAAMAFGTESVPKVDKIFGPGNAWVTEAKEQVAKVPGGAAIDMPAGPSEVLVIADRTARAAFVAADLLSQAEHGPDSQVILVADDAELLPRVRAAIADQLTALPRAAIAERALAHARWIAAPSIETAIEISNRYAPEHLILHVAEPARWKDAIRHAGSVFLGEWTPESAGDYASGTNHVLPTYGFARAWSGLSLDSFYKQITFQQISERGIRELGPTIETLAQLEGLAAHAHAVRIRIEGGAAMSGANEPGIEHVLALVRPAIQKLHAYKSARSLATEARSYLDANESPWPAIPDTTVNRYPEPQPKRLVQAIAELYGTTSERLLVGRGSDEAIDVLVRTFCEAERDAILICPPTYGVYEVAAHTQGAAVHEVQVFEQDAFRIDPPRVLAAWTPAVKLVFYCHPNNPTANAGSIADLVTLARGLAGKAVLVVDEAYIEFSAEGSFVKAAADFANVVVLRTFSKAWAMAGARCGSAIGHPALMQVLQKVRSPYPIPLFTADAVLTKLTAQGRAECAERVRCLVEERAWLAEALGRLPTVEKVFPSDANFVLVRTRDARAFYAAALRRGILLRDRSSEPGLEHCVRITVGTPAENRDLLAALWDG